MDRKLGLTGNKLTSYAWTCLFSCVTMSYVIVKLLKHIFFDTHTALIFLTLRTYMSCRPTVNHCLVFAQLKSKVEVDSGSVKV